VTPNFRRREDEDSSESSFDNIENGVEDEMFAEEELVRATTIYEEQRPPPTSARQREARQNAARHISSATPVIENEKPEHVEVCGISMRKKQLPWCIGMVVLSIFGVVVLVVVLLATNISPNDSSGENPTISPTTPTVAPTAATQQSAVGEGIVNNTSNALICLNPKDETFENHEKAAAFLDGNLVSIHEAKTQAIVSALSAMAPQQDAWIGLDATTNFEVWQDGTRGDYSNWDEEQNEPAGDNCVKVNAQRNHMWKDEKCELPQNGIYSLPNFSLCAAYIAGLVCADELTGSIIAPETLCGEPNYVLQDVFCFAASHDTWASHSQVASSKYAGHLVSIESEEINNIVASMGQDVWIGLERSQGGLQWTDEAPLTYQSWGPGQNVLDNCIMLQSNLIDPPAWFDLQCNSQLSAAYRITRTGLCLALEDALSCLDIRGISINSDAISCQ